MIERTVSPEDRVVAAIAGRRECGRDVIDGRGRTAVVVLVTTHACRVRNGVVIVDVAIRARARRHRVRTG